MQDTKKAFDNGGSRLRRHEVREIFQRMILSGEQKPGSKLRQQEFAARLGVAQGVVREALLELQAHGLVETIDNRGMFVTVLSAERIVESFLVREMHEGLAVRLCCERATRGELRPLIDLSHQMFACASADKLDEMAKYDREFHFQIIHLSRHSMLIRLAENYRVLGKFVKANRPAEIVRDEHLAILAAIEKGAPDRAEKLMREHVAAARVVVQKMIADGKGKLNWMM